MSRKKGNTSPLPGGGNKGGARGSKVCEDARCWLAEATPRRAPAASHRNARANAPSRRVILSEVELLRSRKSAERARRDLGGHYARLPIGHTICQARSRAVGTPCARRKVRLRVAPLRMTHKGEHLLAQTIPRRARVASRRKIRLGLCGFHIRWLPPYSPLPEGGS